MRNIMEPLAPEPIAMDLLLRLDGTQPIYRQIYLGLRDAIATRRLRAGDRQRMR